MCRLLQHDALATPAYTRLVDRGGILGDRHEPHSWQCETCEDILKPFAASRPGLTHHVLPVEHEEIEGEKAHVATVPVALLEYRLNPLVPVSRAGFTVKHGRVYGPRER